MTASPVPQPATLPAALSTALRGGGPFALLARDAGTVEVLTGEVVDVPLLQDIPLHDADGRAREVLALVPFRQVVERGFVCHDDGAPLRCLLVAGHETVTRDEVLATLPSTPVPLGDAGFDIPDEEYAGSSAA